MTKAQAKKIAKLAALVRKARDMARDLADEIRPGPRERSVNWGYTESLDHHAKQLGEVVSENGYDDDVGGLAELARVAAREAV